MWQGGDNMTIEAKVGLFTVTALALALAIVMHLSHFSFGEPPNYKVTASFKYVDGLKPGALVRYAGVDVGNVRTVTTDGVGAKVVLQIKNETKIPQNAVITISSDGLMGEKFVNIYAAEKKAALYLKNNDVVKGTEAHNIETLMTAASATMEKVDKLVTAMNKIIANPAVQDSIINSASNLKKITDNMNEATAVIARLSIANEGNINGMVRNMTAITANMQQTTGQIEKMMNQLNGDGQMAENMRGAIANLSATSARIDKMAANLEPVIADPDTAAELKSMIHNASDVSKRANKMMTKINSIHTKVGADFLYNGKESDMMFNADLKLYNDSGNFLLLGGDDIGGDNPATNLQLGAGNDFFSGRVGLVDNNPGIGLDTYLGLWKFSVDAYDDDKVKLKLRSQYKLSPDYYLVGQVNNLNDSAKRLTYFGLRKEF